MERVSINVRSNQETYVFSEPLHRAPRSYSSSPQSQLCQLYSGCVVRHCTSPPCHTGVTTCVLRTNPVSGVAAGLLLWVVYY